MIRDLLTGGDRRTLGRANEAAKAAAEDPELFAELIQLLWDADDAIVRMRAADATEKASSQNPDLLKPWKRELLALLCQATQQELRWHLAQIVPRLPLTANERVRASKALRHYLTDRSSIVKTSAMQALADLALHDPGSIPEVSKLIEQLMETGTPAMKARGKKLLSGLRNTHPAIIPSSRA